MPNNQIYNFLKENGLTEKSETDFINEYSNPNKANELYLFFKENNLTQKNSDEFYNEYLKKKEDGFRTVAEKGATQKELEKNIGAEFEKPIEILEAESNILTAKNKDLNFVKRATEPDKYPSLQTEDGKEKTHKLEWGDDGVGNYYVYPTIIQDKKTGELKELNSKDAFNYAMESGEYIKTDSPQTAEYYKNNGLLNREQLPEQSDTSEGFRTIHEKINAPNVNDKIEATDIPEYITTIKNKYKEYESGEFQKKAEKGEIDKPPKIEGDIKIMDDKQIPLSAEVFDYEDKSKQKPGSSLEYILEKGYNQSMIGLADAIHNKNYRINPEYLEKYDANTLENTLATAFGFILDAPFFWMGGKAGSTAAKPIVNKIVNNGTQKLVNSGIERKVAEQIAKKSMAKLTGAINSMASSGVALGSYGFTMGAMEQWADPENDFKDIEWSQALARGGKDFLLGTSVGLIGSQFANLGKAAQRIESPITRKTIQTALVPTAITAENTVFIYGGALLDGRKLSDVTAKEFLEGELLLGVLKAKEPIKFAKDFKRSLKYENEKAGKGIYEIDLTQSELNDLKYKNYDEAITDLSKNDAKLTEVFKDKDIPAITKAKLLWGSRGIKWEKNFYADYTYAEGNEVKTFNKEGVLLDKEAFTSKEEANSIAMERQSMIENSKKLQQAASLTESDKAKVINNISVEAEPLNDALRKSPQQRTAEERKMVSDFNKEVDKIIVDAQKKGLYEPIPELRLSDETLYTLNKIEDKEPVINQRIKDAANELFREYQRIGKLKEIPGRKNTIEQLNESRAFLEKEITRLDNMVKEQENTRKFVKDDMNETFNKQEKPKEIKKDEIKFEEKTEVKGVEKPVDIIRKPDAKTETLKEELVQFGDEMPAKKSMVNFLKSDPENTFTTPIVKNGEKIGDITIDKKDKTWDVKWIEIDPDKRDHGNGKDTYRKMNELAQKEGKVLQSDTKPKLNTETAGYVWESLVKSKEAIKTEDGRYQMLPLKETAQPGVEAATKPSTEKEAVSEPLKTEQNEPTIKPTETKEAKKPEPKEVTFEFIGEPRKGIITEQGDGFVKVKDSRGINHTIKEGDTKYRNVKMEGMEFKETVSAAQILDKEIAKTRKEKLTEKEQEVKNRLAERLQKLSGAKFITIEEKSNNLKEIYGVINDLAELGLIKIEKGIDHVMSELKKYFPDKDIDKYKTDIEENIFGKQEKPKAENYDNVLKSIEERKIAEKSFREKTRKKIKSQFNKLVVDKSENFRQKILSIDKEEGQRAVNYFNLQAGSSSKSKMDFDKARRKIFGGVGKIMDIREQELLGEYIDKKRIVELDNLYDKRKQERLKHEGGVTGEEAQLFLDAIKNKDQKLLDKFNLSDVDAKKLENAANEYYDVMRNNLKRLYDEGIISEQSYNKLAEEQPFYSKRMYIDHINSIDGNGKLSGIESLKEGSESSKVVDVQTLLGDNITRTDRIIFANRAKKALNDVAVKFPENGYIAEAEYSNEYFNKLAKELEKPEKDRQFIEPSFKEAPKGFTIVEFMDNGKKKGFYLENELYKEYEFNPDPEWLDLTKNIIGWASGTKLLKAGATGYNPEFAIKNVPLDMLHIMTSTEEYSSTYAIATPQMLNDMRKVFKDASTRSGRFIDYMEQGGGMDYLTTQGSLSPRKYKKYNNLNNGLKALSDVASYMGNTSEILTRLALRERYIDNRLNALKKEGITPTKENIKEIEFAATAYARNYLDFAQGGKAIKLMDAGIPYLNAGIQVTRGTLRAAARNKKAFWYKFGQLGLTAAAITAYNMGVFSRGDDEEKNERAEYYKNEISDRNKANNFIIMTGLNYIDKQGNKRYLYIKIPKDQTQQLVTGLFEDLYLKYVHGDSEHQILNDRRFMELKALTKNVGDVAGMPPMITAITGYKNNVNLFYQEAIWYGDELGKDKSEEYYIGRTPERFIEWGKLTGMSPERTRYATQQFITGSNMFGTILGEGLDYMVADLDKEIKTELNKTTSEKVKNMPFARRFIGETSPYSRESSAKTAQQEINREQTKNDHELDRILLSDSKPDDIVDFIVKQEPYEAKRLVDRYFDKLKLEGVNKQVKDLMFYPPEARAKGFYDMIKNKPDKEVQKIMSDAVRIGGIITEGRFMEELIKLSLEDGKKIQEIKAIKNK